MAKMCELCKTRPATVPDRNCMGRPINRVCSDCHAARLRGDLINVVKSHNKKFENGWGKKQPQPFNFTFFA